MPSQRYTEGPPAFRAASVVPLDSTRTWAFPWILSSAVPAFLESLAAGSLEQPPNAASVSTRKQKMRALRFIRHTLAFETFSSESEGITGHDRLQRTVAHSSPRLLRREGLYSSHLVTWRRERQAGILKGLTPHKRGPKSKRNPPEEEMRKLRRENQRLTEE